MKSREQIESVILAISIREKLPPGRRVVVIIELAGGSERITPFIRIDGAKPVQEPRAHGTTESRRSRPSGLKKGTLQAEFIPPSQTGGGFTEQIRSVILIIVLVRTVRVKPFGGE